MFCRPSEEFGFYDQSAEVDCIDVGTGMIRFAFTHV
jgi:hypothetical protein